MIGNQYSRILDDEMTAMQSMVVRLQEQDEERVYRYAYLLATMPRLIDAIERRDSVSVKDIIEASLHQLGIDSIAVTDSTGIVLARGFYELAGDDISERPEVSGALRGETVNGIVFQEAAMVPYCIRTYMPVYNSGATQVGVLILGVDIGTESYVDSLKNITGMEVTLYKDDVRIMTTLKDEEGNRAIDTRLEDPEVLDTVLNRGELIVKSLDIFGDPYKLVYWPVIDFRGEIVGMWTIAAPLTEQIAMENRFMMIIISCSIGVALLFTILAGVLGSKIAKPIRDVTNYAVQVADGNLEIPLAIKSNDEVELLATALQTMVETLKDRIQQNELQLARMHLMVRATKIGLWDMEIIQDDPINNNNVIIWSNEFRELLGYSDQSEFPDIVKSFHDRIHPDDYERVATAILKHLLDKTGQTPYDVEYRLLKKSGEYGDYLASGETIRDKDGNPVHTVGSLIDVTEMKNLIYEADRQRTAAEEASKAKSVFLSTMSHEIRTPMNVILGMTEVQLQRDNLDADIKEAFKMIYSSGDVLLSIINNILDLSKIEAGRLEIQVEKYEVASLISDAAQLNMLQFYDKPVGFELVVDDKLPTMLLGDELRIKQILSNLLSNAFKYTSVGSVSLTFFAETSDNDTVNDEMILGIIVSDTGQGMTADQVNVLFDEYNRFNPEANRSTEGTGLGMSITRTLLHLMDGEIRVESEPGKGSKFTVRIPQIRIGSEMLGKENAENLSRFRAYSGANLKRVQIKQEPMAYGSVLIVDDMKTNVFVAKELLAPYKLHIEAVLSGFEAIDIIKSGKVYDIIFMDHMMPKMDGIDTTKILRDMGYSHPIVALTANAVVGQSDMFLENGFDEFISKPINVSKLNAVLNQFVRDRRTSEFTEFSGEPEPPEMEQESLYSDDVQFKEGINPGVINIFIGDARAHLRLLEEFVKSGCPRNDLRMFVVSAHGLRSALAYAGNAELSVFASKLEQLGRSGDIESLEHEIPVFNEALRDCIEKLASMVVDADFETIDCNQANIELLHSKLHEVKAACYEFDKASADDIIKELRKISCSQAVKKLLRDISANLLHGEFDEAANAVSEFLAEDN